MIGMEMSESKTDLVSGASVVQFSDDESELVSFAAPQKCFYLVRHPDTDMNKDHVVRGWDDPKVSKLGKQQAKMQAKWFDDKGILFIETSDMKRTKYSAKKISKRTGAPIHEITRVLRSWNLGEFDGRKVEDVAPLIEAWVREKPDVPIPAGESFDSFKSRVLHCAKKVMATYQNGDVGPIIQCTHSRNIRMVAAYVKAGCMADDTIDLDAFFNTKIPEAGILRVSMDMMFGRWNVRTFDPIPVELRP